ncbi:MAPEG family protein [Solimonas sp. K1W22B-7]|uniref:MAPEG family protein n=1 Tax=Solimonas sp. K1W22B-7 TaxID=2303331 RepID=UPI000E331507|nr:MAPEG family protein [Solimonas sp. K1W22B-7]AXQ30116.1 MAPEG family protein [Solimonas sp. K1W22B-7]
MNPQYPALGAYALTSILLVLNLLFLWGYSGATRGRTKIAINPEDAARFGGTLRDTDPPEVARVLRAHRNAEAAIYPFLLLGLVYVLLGGGLKLASALFAVFVFARYVHSWAYLSATQPWRTISFIIGGLATIVLLLDIAWMLLRG